MTSLKRICDVVLSSFGLLLTLPFLPLVVMLVFMNSPGPVIYRQVRVGKGGRNFVLYKFRTMCRDAEQDSGAVWVQQNDSRLKPIGSFLRKWRVDEIPQLFNVLKGDMSFIGPRPERPEFVDNFNDIIPFYVQRHLIKPGLTGWAQVRFPYGSSLEDTMEKLRYDLYYLKNMSPILDGVIFMKTLRVVILGSGGR